MVYVCGNVFVGSVKVLTHKALRSQVTVAFRAGLVDGAFTKNKVVLYREKGQMRVTTLYLERDGKKEA